MISVVSEVFVKVIVVSVIRMMGSDSCVVIRKLIVMLVMLLK